MKRHAGLIPFSHDHHEGLVIAQRLLQGRSKSPRSNWPVAPEAQRDRVIEFFQGRLRHHLAAEEEILFPLARRFVAHQSDLVDDLLQEHRDLQHGVEQLASADPQLLSGQLRDWAQLLHDHIRKEERRLFQAMQKGIPDHELEACQERVKAFYAESGRAQDSCLW